MLSTRLKAALGSTRAQDIELVVGNEQPAGERRREIAHHGFGDARMLCAKGIDTLKRDFKAEDGRVGPDVRRLVMLHCPP